MVTRLVGRSRRGGRAVAGGSRSGSMVATPAATTPTRSRNPAATDAPQESSTRARMNTRLATRNEATPMASTSTFRRPRMVASAAIAAASTAT
jgi:hypothetical protein